MTLLSDEQAERLNQIMDDAFAADGMSLARGSKIRVTTNGKVIEGTFEGLFVNVHDGLGMLVAYIREDDEGHTIKGKVGVPGAHIARLEWLAEPTS